MAVMEAERNNQNLEWRAELLQVMPKKPGLGRLEPVLMMLRLRVKLRMRLRTDELQKGETVYLQLSFPHLAVG